MPDDLFHWLLLGALVLYATGTGAADNPPAVPVMPVQTLAGDELPLSVDVYYATNREYDRHRSAGDVYTGNRGELHVGRCVVAFQPIRFLNQLAPRLPFYLANETREVIAVEPETPEPFWQRLQNAAAQTASESVVVFVHGYNYSFGRTCRMAAELQRSLGQKATVLMFSWPSNGSPADYVSDLTDVEWSVPSLAALLKQLHERLGAGNVQVLAHSMGSRGVIFALHRLSADSHRQPLIERLVFLAPDFDTATFAELLPRLSKVSNNMTLYASGNDTPLRASEELNGHPRLGQAGEHLTVLAGIETIDVSPAGLYQIMGHEYFFYHPKVTADLVNHVGSGTPAAERTGLRRRQRDGGVYWEISP